MWFYKCSAGAAFSVQLMRFVTRVLTALLQAPAEMEVKEVVTVYYLRLARGSRELCGQQHAD